MKKIVTLFLALAMLCAALSMAAGEEQPQFATLLDALDAAGEDAVVGAGSEYVAVIVGQDGRYYRAVALLDEHAKELYTAMGEADADHFGDAGEAFDQYIRTLPVSYTELITAAPKGQAELDALDGKTVRELEDMGFRCYSSGSGGEGDPIVFTMVDGMFSYDFEADTTYDEYLRLMEQDETGSLKVRNGCYAGFSDLATVLSVHADGTVEPPEEEFTAEEYDLMIAIADEIESAWKGGDLDREALIVSLTEKYPEAADMVREMVETFTEGEPEDAEPDPSPAPRSEAEIEAMLRTACYINPDGGNMVHTVPDCRIVHPKYLPLTRVEYTDEIKAAYSFCPVCCLNEYAEEP